MNDYKQKTLIDDSGIGTLTISNIKLSEINNLKGFELEYSFLTDVNNHFSWIVINHGKKFVTSKEVFVSKGIYIFKNRTVFLPTTEFGLNKARAFEQTINSIFGDE